MAHEMAVTRIQQYASVMGVEPSISIRFHQVPLTDQNPNFQNRSVHTGSFWLLVTGYWSLAAGRWLLTTDSLLFARSKKREARSRERMNPQPATCSI
jgi:uncharacterized cupin superfamily protein